MATLPPLASLEDLQARLGHEITEPVDVARAGAVLDDASAIIRRVTRNSWTDGAPDEVRAICLRLAVTAYTNPDGIRQESIGGYSYTLAGTGDQLGAAAHLTRFELRVLQAYRAGQTTTTAPTERPERDETVINLPEEPV